MDSIPAKIKYIAFDTETSGLDSKKNSILTAYFCALSDSLAVVDELYLKIKPQPEHVIDESAMKVSQIDLALHNETAVDIQEAKIKLATFLKKHKLKGRSKILPLGHNIAFDLDFIFSQLMPKIAWEEVLSYRLIDTMPVVSFLKEANLLPKELGNLSSLVDYFGVTKRDAHNAKEDVLMTVDVFGKLLGFVQNTQSSVGGLDEELLDVIER